MRNFTATEINRLMGKIYYFDKVLYGQIKDLLLEWRNLAAMLEEVNDEIVKAYLSQKKGEVENELLRRNIRTDYPNYPKMEE